MRRLDMIEVLRLDGARRTLRIATTDRRHEDMHPGHVDADTLRRRQARVTTQRWSMADQVHGRGVVFVSCPPPAGAPTVGVGDVLVSTAVGTPVAVWTADCAPLFLVDADATVIVGAHVGWRGLALGVVDVAVEAFEQAPPGRPVAAAALGPTIGPCCYGFGAADLRTVADAVDLEVSAIAGATAEGRPSLDMVGAVRRLLARRGIELSATGPCTSCDDRCFSHRRGDTARMATVAWSEPALARQVAG